MEPRKMVLMSLFAEKQWRCRPEKQTYGRDRVGQEEEGGTNGETSMEAYTPPRVKQTANGNLLCDSGISTRGSVTT